ncbi:hypothetical protein VTK73DRAFT_7658 [Phialemonium thermophilum]|uniref:Uncharacterized protein n=1 Tax=Phialemonium thermophilum TaxID=223376 RepID=A0ABR3Y6F4_9PEZI
MSIFPLFFYALLLVMFVSRARKSMSSSFRPPPPLFIAGNSLLRVSLVSLSRPVCMLLLLLVNVVMSELASRDLQRKASPLWRECRERIDMHAARARQREGTGQVWVNEPLHGVSLTLMSREYPMIRHKSNNAFHPLAPFPPHNYFPASDGIPLGPLSLLRPPGYS